MSCRTELPAVLERRRRFRRALKVEDRPAMDVCLAALARHGPTTFGTLDDPLEAAVVAALLEFGKGGGGA
jgi:hypothetical protein